MTNSKIEIKNLSDKLGKEAQKITLPNGRVIKAIVWEGSDLPQVARLLHGHSYGKDNVVDIDGAAPAWLVSAITHEVHPAHVRVNSPDGFIPVGCSKPTDNGNGENIKFSVETRPDGWTVVTAEAVDPSIPFNPDSMGSISPPDVGMGAKVIISGRIPNWMTASFAMAYHGQSKAVACFQPGVGATVAWTHSVEVEIGKIIK